ncbi:LEM3 (ligand-effect modulator 3) family / CDC50 family protein [Cryptosporidium hominis]|nr:putative integral membrane protein [Cryptosporidium hominis]PPA63405.1 LEM3 (ligand-effect modulator 3) family / CDC50 family protein [Cryptosporidium hominis]
MTINQPKFFENIREKITNNRNYSLLTKAIKADATFEWTRDEVSLITYWILQICALLFGVGCGIFGLKGATVLISAILGLVFIGITYLNLLDIPERILDPTEIVIENVATCLNCHLRMNSNYYRHELSNLVWIQRLRKGEKKVDEILESFVQQDMKIWNPGKYLFSPKIAIILFLIGGVFHAVFAAFFFFNYRSNSYVDRPSDIFPGFTCGTAKTITYLRQVRGNTLDNYINKIQVEKNDEETGEEVPLIPCGLSSITFYNDKFEIYMLKEDGKKELINVEIDQLSLKNDFSMFAVPYNKMMWIKTTDIHYRIWMHGAWLPSFKMVWGQISHGLKRGKYEIKMIDNMWPAENFNSKKRLGIERVSFLGSKNIKASYFFFIWSVWLFTISFLFIFMLSCSCNTLKIILRSFLESI